MLYTVKYDDSLSSIAAAHHISPADLSTLNQLDPHAKPVVGQSLIIPGKSRPTRRIIVHSPVLPVIGESSLLNISPYLTYASVCAARILAEGHIAFPNDFSIVSRAASLGISPLLTLSNKHPNNELCKSTLHALLHSREAKETFISTLMNHLRCRGYTGVNIDFSEICTEDASAYSEFIHMLKEALHMDNLILLTTVYKSDKHLSSASEYADYTIILPWEREHISRHPVPFSPVDEVREMIEQTAEILPKERILMGMPSHGYNWKLPCHGASAPVVYLNEAPTLAYNNFADIRYDDTVQSPHFSYYDSAGSEHMVWFHDPRSISARLALAEEYSLGGISWQNTAPLYRPGWICIAEKFRIHKLI